MKACNLLSIALLVALPMIGLGDLPEPDQTLAPYFKVITGHESETDGTEPFPLLSTDIDVKISGVIANVEAAN